MNNNALLKTVDSFDKKKLNFPANKNYLKGRCFTKKKNSVSLISYTDDAKSNNTSFFFHVKHVTETKSYTPITSCVLEHIITTTNLTNYEKLYYLLADSLALINYNKGNHRTYALPSEDWADRLGCSRSLVFTMQKSLEEKGYFIINKDFDEIGLNKRNLITPTLPISVFNHLNEKFPNRAGDHPPYNHLSECKRSYLDRAKLFIKLNYYLLKLITSNEYINPKQKILWLSFYTRCYKNYMLQDREDFNVGKYNHNDDSSFSFISSYQELADLHSCDTKHLSKSIKALEELGFISAQNIYVRKRCSDNNDCKIQERQDQSLWKITLSLPENCILELEKVKDRSNLKLNDINAAAIENTVNSTLIENCLILGDIKYNLDLEQSSILKSIIDGSSNGNGVECKNNVDFLESPCTTSYIDSIMEELDVEDAGDIANALDELNATKDSDFLSDEPKILSQLSSTKTFDNKESKSDGIKSDPNVAKSGLLLNKDLLLKIKDIKSNLRATPKVLFNDFLKKIKKQDSADTQNGGKKNTAGFNICSELIRENLKILPKDKADKARKFAYSLVSKKLAKGYAAGINKQELAKQLINHAATWKPTKLGAISREKEIDISLAVAWKSIVSGTWQPPLQWAKAEVLNYEYQYYHKKYQESGVLSLEIRSLESTVNSLLGGWRNLEGKIIEASKEVVSRKDITVIAPTLNLENSITASTPCEEIWLKGGNTAIKINDYHSQNDDETELLNNNYNVDLSNLPQSQKHLKILGSNTDLIEINTINHQQYFGTLKILEVNQDGDLVMTLRPSGAELFSESSTFTPVLNESTKFLGENKSDNFSKNTTVEKLGNAQLLNQEHLLPQGFIKVDSVLSSILRKL